MNRGRNSGSKIPSGLKSLKCFLTSLYTRHKGLRCKSSVRIVCKETDIMMLVFGQQELIG